MLENVHCFFSQALHKLLNEQPVTFFPGSKPCELPKEMEPGNQWGSCPHITFLQSSLWACNELSLFTVIFGKSSKNAQQLSPWGFIGTWQASLENRQVFLSHPKNKANNNECFPEKQTLPLGCGSLIGRGKHTQNLLFFCGMNSGFSWEVVLLHVGATLLSVTPEQLLPLKLLLQTSFQTSEQTQQEWIDDSQKKSYWLFHWLISVDFFFLLKQDCPLQLVKLCLWWAEASAFILLRTWVWVTKAKDTSQGLGGKRPMD